MCQGLEFREPQESACAFDGVDTTENGRETIGVIRVGGRDVSTHALNVSSVQARAS